MEGLMLCGIYVTEFVCFGIGIKLLFEERLKTFRWSVLGIGFAVAAGFPPIPAVGKNVVITMVVMCVIFLSLEGKTIEKIAKIVLLLVFLNCIEDVFLCLSGRINRVAEIVTNVNHMVYLGVKGCTLISVSGLYYLKRHIQSKKIIRINIYVYVILGIAVSLMMFCAATLNYTKEVICNDRYWMLCDVLDIATRIGIFQLVIYIVYIKNTNERTEQLWKTEQMLKETQVNYYRQLLRAEEDTRKYRHDMNNHLIFVRELLMENRLQEAREYVEKIQCGFVNIQKRYYATGNEMVDAIMNYFLGSLPDGVPVEISGKVPVELELEDTDICTIFSNLFQNIVEEMRKKDVENGRVEISIEKGQEYVKYEIENTTGHNGCERLKENGLPESHKEDKRNHGIGLANVKKTVEQNKGRFSWERKENMFCVSVILPLKK